MSNAFRLTGDALNDCEKVIYVHICVGPLGNLVCVESLKETHGDDVCIPVLCTGTGTSVGKRWLLLGYNAPQTGVDEKG